MCVWLKFNPLIEERYRGLQGAWTVDTNIHIRFHRHIKTVITRVMVLDMFFFLPLRKALQQSDVVRKSAASAPVSMQKQNYSKRFQGHSMKSVEDVEDDESRGKKHSGWKFSLSRCTFKVTIDGIQISAHPEYTYYSFPKVRRGRRFVPIGARRHIKITARRKPTNNIVLKCLVIERVIEPPD